ncbi:Na+/H+ antiporter subunit E [Marinobacter sp. 1_MG-2023]|uniref:Na+/H+ antiporter subunit E n=1 Tax=Marinobacter sp. 1_MG-2023 TaxID=3062627 RepID=UPI0026E1AC86|nr:Na+/H+ antiporter subunit E [Marinobacter sp. 1_MG-2023]MDO6822775.1 Na+/H+ antiporter subunit E [Marinobacter sp. 1_MG-2023]
MKTVATILGRVILLLLVWWAFTEGDVSGIGFGLVIAILVAAVSMRLYPRGTARIRPVQLWLFVLFFLGRSVVAGIDVARRVLSPSLPVDPGYFTVHLTLPEGSPRWLLANALSLMPGTLSVSLDGPRLELHCLDTQSSVEEDVRAAEQKVARVFGLPLPDETCHSEGAR